MNHIEDEPQLEGNRSVTPREAWADGEGGNHDEDDYAADARHHQIDEEDARSVNSEQLYTERRPGSSVMTPVPQPVQLPGATQMEEEEGQPTNSSGPSQSANNE